LIIPFSSYTTTYIHVSISSSADLGFDGIHGSVNKAFTNAGPIIIEIKSVNLSFGDYIIELYIGGAFYTYSSDFYSTYLLSI
jgi:hypothetical protein